MGAKKELYLAVKKRILDNTNVRHCALYNSQFDNMENEDAFLFPCVFIEFGQLTWLTKSEGLQEADTIIRLHVGFESLNTEELEILDLIEDIHEDLQRFQVVDLFTPLDRGAEGQDNDHDNVTVWTMDYDTLLSDNSGNRKNKMVLATITDINVTGSGSAPRLKHL